MTLAFRPSLPSDGYAIECRRAVIQAYARSVATVLTVRGDVDSLNAECVYRNLARFKRLDTALVIDITEANVADLDVLRGFATDHGVSASIVARPEQGVALDCCLDEDAVPTFSTVADAVQHFVRSIQARRDPRSLRFLRPA